MRTCTECNTSKELEMFAEVSDKQGTYRRKKCKSCFTSLNRERSNRYYKANKAKVLARQQAAYTSNKDSVYAHYGSSCDCCGETEKLFLTIDHIDNDGHLHRKGEDTSHHNIYGWLVRNGFPVGFQVLCMNCNQGKHRNNGVCPHKTVI